MHVVPNFIISINIL